MRKEGKCMHCMLEKRPYLHNIYYKNSVLEFCTSCVLKLNPGKFCPLCFSVYENEDPNSNPPAVCCSMCSAIAHFDCFMHTSASSSSYDPTANFVCRSCSDPEFQFFDWKEGGRVDLRGMDMGLAVQLVAASFISGRSMRDGADLCRQKAEVKAEQAALARKEATKALELLAELTAPDPVPESSDDHDGDDEEEYSSEYEYEYSDEDEEFSDEDDEYIDEGDEDERMDDYKNIDEEAYGAEDERSDEEEPGDEETIDEDELGDLEDDNNEEEGGDEEANSQEDSSGKPSG